MAKDAPAEVTSHPSQAAQHTENAFQKEANGEHPGFFARQWNVTKTIAAGAYDRAADDVINFKDHPLRSAGELAVGGVAAAGLVAGGMEVGAAAAVYAGVAGLATEAGALVGAGTAAAILGPGADRLAGKTIQDLHDTSAARTVVGDPTSHSATEVADAKAKVSQTLGADMLQNFEIYGSLALGAVAGETFARSGRSEAKTAQTNSLRPSETTVGKASGDATTKESSVDNTAPPEKGPRITRREDGTIANTSGDGVTVLHAKDGSPNSVLFRDGQNHVTISKTGDAWTNDKHSDTKYSVTVDEKTGVTVQGDGTLLKLGYDGSRTVDRYSGYEETRLGGDKNDPALIERLKVPAGLELTKEPLPNGESRLTVKKDDQQWVSEPGSAANGWEFKNQPTLPGATNPDSILKITKDGPKSPGDPTSDWDISVANKNGPDKTTFGSSGWQRTVRTEGGTTEDTTTDSRQSVASSKFVDGKLTINYDRDGQFGTRQITTIDTPVGSIRSAPGRPTKVQEGGQFYDAKGVTDKYDPTDPQKHGYAVDLGDGKSRVFWNDGTISGADKPAST